MDKRHYGGSVEFLKIGRRGDFWPLLIFCPTPSFKPHLDYLTQLFDVRYLLTQYNPFMSLKMLYRSKSVLSDSVNGPSFTLPSFSYYLYSSESFSV